MNPIRTPRARILWISSEDPGFESAREIFASAGYALMDRGPPPYDAAVIDLRKRQTPSRWAEDAVSRLRQSSPEAGVIFVADHELPAAQRANLRRAGELALGHEPLAAAVSLCRQKLRIRNIAEETGERLKSVAAQTRLSEFPPIDTSSDPPSTLIAGAPGAHALAALAAGADVSERCDAALSAGQAMRALEAGLYDCAVFIPQNAGDPLLGLARTMRRHRRFQDMPLIIVRDQTARLEAEAPPNAEFIDAHHVSADLPARLVVLTRRARLLAAMRRFLRACAGDGVKDRLSGAFTPAFFGQHAMRVFSRADATRRPASLIGVRLAPVADETADAAGGRTLNEAARLINRVTRAEDFVGRLTSDTFVVLAGATVGSDAGIAARRIEGVIANTMFRSRVGRRLFAVAAATAAVERPNDRPLEETLAEVLARLHSAPMHTAER